MPTETKNDGRGGSVVPGLSLAAGGAGVSRLSKTLSDVFERAGLGRSPKLTREAVQFIDRFGDSLNGRVGDWDDFLYNYAQTGSDAARVRLFQGRDVSLADDIIGLKHDVMQALGRKVEHALERPFGVRVGPNRISKRVMPLLNDFMHAAGDRPGATPEEIENAILARQKGIAHYKSFELGPRQAYAHMIAEHGFGDTIGDLADSILDARKNYANPNNAAHRVFDTPEQYFAWKSREHIGPASYRPIRSDYKNLSDFKAALRDYNRSGRAPVFSKLFENSKHLTDRESLILELAAGKVPRGKSLDSIAGTSIKGIMDQIAGESNNVMRWVPKPGGRGYVLSGKPNAVGFRNFADMRQNKALLQHYVDPILGRSFRKAPGSYATALLSARLMSLLSRRPVRIAGRAAAAVGAVSAATALVNKLRSHKPNMVKKSAEDERPVRNLTMKDILYGLGGLGSASAASMYGQRFSPRDMNPFARINAAVIGGTKNYDSVARDAMGKSVALSSRALKAMDSGRDSVQSFLSELSAIKTDNPVLKDQIDRIALGCRDFLKSGKKPGGLNELLIPRINTALRLDSFTAQTHATIDALRKGGVNVDDMILRATNNAVNPVTRVYDPRLSFLPSDLDPKRLRNADMLVQVGSHPAEDMLRNERLARGAKLYRVNTDFGPGNFMQPDNWLESLNWMKVNNPKLYDRIITPGLKHFERIGEMPAWMRGLRKSLNVGNIAVSPIFENMQFSENLPTFTGTGRAKAMYTFGGGAGGFLGLGEPVLDEAAQLDLKRNRVLDDMLGALRKRHGNNFDLDLYVGNALDDVAAKTVSGAPTTLPHNKNVRRFLKQIEDALVPESERAGRGLGPLTAEQRALAERFRGLRIIRGVPQSEIAKAYANSDYIFMVPGSTSAEFASIKNNAKGVRGHLISIIPDEALKGRISPGGRNWMPQHFTPNAKYVESILPPGTASRVNIASATRAIDLEKAVAAAGRSAGLTERAAAKRMLHPSKDWAKAVRTMKRDVRLGRAGRAGKFGLLALPAVMASGYGINRVRDLIMDAKRKPAPKPVPAPKPSSKNNSHALQYALAGGAGAAALLAAVQIARSRRKKKMEQDEDDFAE